MCIPRMSIYPPVPEFHRRWVFYATLSAVNLNTNFTTLVYLLFKIHWASACASRVFLQPFHRSSKSKCSIYNNSCTQEHLFAFTGSYHGCCSQMWGRGSKTQNDDLTELFLLSDKLNKIECNCLNFIQSKGVSWPSTDGFFLGFYNP